MPNATFKKDALPHDLAAYEREAQTMSQMDFASSRPHPFLLYARSTLWDPALVPTHAAFGQGAQTMPVDYNFLTGGITFLSPVKKVQSDPRLLGVLLGRGAVGNDMVVPVSSISTRHAQFMPPGSSSPDQWCVVDLKSSNKTFLGEEPIPPERPTVITDGDYLRLGGNLIAWFLLPARLWYVLHTPAELSRLMDLS